MINITQEQIQESYKNIRIARDILVGIRVAIVPAERPGSVQVSELLEAPLNLMIRSMSLLNLDLEQVNGDSEHKDS